MANTKKLKPEIRKHRKRAARKALKQVRASMTREERKGFKKEEKLTLKAFLARRRAEAKAKAKAAAEKKAGEATPSA